MLKYFVSEIKSTNLLPTDGDTYILKGIVFLTITPEKVRLPLNKLHLAGGTI